jgi:hypothetical protein
VLKASGLEKHGELMKVLKGTHGLTLRPIYVAILKSVKRFGKDVDVASKKTHVSLRRGKQFAIVRASTKDRLDLGLNMKGVKPTARLAVDTVFGGMGSHRVRLQGPGEVDKQVIDWLRRAYAAA